MNSGRREEQNLSIQEASRRYTTIIENNFERKENQLIQQLTQQAHTLKLELAFFKKEVSQENIEKLITEKRREKER